MDQATRDRHSQRTQLLAQEGQAATWMTSSSPEEQGLAYPEGRQPTQSCLAGSPLLVHFIEKEKDICIPDRQLRNYTVCAQRCQGIKRVLKEDGKNAQIVCLYKNTPHRFSNKPPK